MRELTMIDTCCLATLLVASLALPLAHSWRSPRPAPPASSRTVWLGQGMLAAAGAWLLATPVLAPLAVAAGVAGVVACAASLARQPRLG